VETRKIVKLQKISFGNNNFGSANINKHVKLKLWKQKKGVQEKPFL